MDYSAKSWAGATPATPEQQFIALLDKIIAAAEDLNDQLDQISAHLEQTQFDQAA